MLKYIPTSWRDDLRTNFDSSLNFYINPRGRTIPALTDAGNTYIKNDVSTNMRGTYRMQCGASTNLTYLYTLPQRFIIEGWFKPEFAYDVAGEQYIFFLDAVNNHLRYGAATDTLRFITSVGGSPAALATSAFTSNAELQRWIYVRLFFDNLAKLKGFYCTVNGVVYADTQNVPGAGTFTPLNTISFMPTVAAESSYWIIHELDETLATGEYKTYQADRQIMFDFNGTTLARERIRIPRNSAAADLRGVKSIDSLHYAVENQGGSACANTAGLSLYNIKGQFSDDQYDAFDPFQGYYNGTVYQKYLQNRVLVEIESESPANTVRDGLIGHWSFDDQAATATDNSGYGNTGTITDATYVDGISGKALRFDGTNDRVVTTRQNPTTAMSVSVWCKTSAVVGRLVSQYFAGDIGFILGIGSATNGKPRFRVSSDGATLIALEASSTVNDGAWHHIVGVFVGSTSLKIYIDAADAGTNTTSIPASIYASTKSITIGSDPANAINFTGDIDEVRIYNRALTQAEITWLYAHPSDWGAISKAEPLLVGRTTPGAFSRNSPNAMYGEVSIEIEDGVAELGETKMNQAYSFTTHDICDPAAETDSLVHDIARLVTKKTIKNYALNSSVENATIANSWTNTGMATFERSSTQALFGTYSMKCIADTIGDNVMQIIEFETTDLIDIGDTFNFSAFVYQGTASAVKISIAEFDTSGSIIGTASETTCGTDTSVWTRVNVSRTILSALCTQIQIGVVAVQTSTFYVDGFMLTRGYDALDYFLVNATDGASGVGSADSAASYSYDTVGIDADAVDIEHPFAIVKKGEAVWDHLKKISDASIGYYLGMTPDGTLRFANRYAEAGTSTPSNLGTVDDFGGIATSLEIEQANAIKVYGYAVETCAKTQLFSGMNAAGFTKVDGKMRHPVANGAAASWSGATTVECVYSENAEWTKRYAMSGLPTMPWEG
ncbi:MAG: LamG domain-containing protein [Candidatus Omnitrophota bacterium]